MNGLCMYDRCVQIIRSNIYTSIDRYLQKCLCIVRLSFSPFADIDVQLTGKRIEKPMHSIEQVCNGNEKKKERCLLLIDDEPSGQRIRVHETSMQISIQTSEKQTEKQRMQRARELSRWTLKLTIKITFHLRPDLITVLTGIFFENPHFSGRIYSFLATPMIEEERTNL